MGAPHEKVSKQELKDLIDVLPESELYAAKRYIQYWRDSHDSALKPLMEAPWDDEPFAEEDLNAIEQANENIATGRVLSQYEIEKELGL